MNVRFRRLIEGELVWSGIARYNRRIKKSQRTIKRLLGIPYAAQLRPLAPNFFRQISSRLPVELQHSETDLRENYSLHPVFMLAEGKRGNRYRTLCGRVENPWTPSLNLTTRRETFLKFCLRCRQDDLKECGEAGWRVAHQIPGTTCCSLHKCVLIDSNVSALSTDLVALDDIPAVASTRLPTPSEIRFAQIGSLLLKRQKDLPSLKHIGLAIVAAEFGDGAALRPEKYIRKLAGRIQHELPEVSSIFRSGPKTEIRRLANQLNGISLRVSGIATIAALAIISSSLEDVLEIAIRIAQQEIAPFPCTNQFSACRGRFTVYSVKPSRLGESAVFRCPDCQHGYRRKLPLARFGPDPLEFEYEVTCQGHIPREKLAPIWNDCTKSWDDLEAKLRLSMRTIGRIAARLRLGDQPNRSLAPFRTYVSRHSRNRSTVNSSKTIFLSLVKKRPLSSDEFLVLERARHFLYRHATQWVKQNTPIRKAFREQSDWKAREANWLGQIEGLRQRAIFSSEKRPGRIGLGRLCSAFSPRLHPNYLKKMPKLRIALAKQVESRDDYIIRRVLDILKIPRKDNGPYSMAELLLPVRNYRRLPAVRRLVADLWSKQCSASDQADLAVA